MGESLPIGGLRRSALVVTRWKQETTASWWSPRRLPFGSRKVDDHACRIADPAGIAGHFDDHRMPQLGVVGVALDDDGGPFLTARTCDMRNSRQDDIPALQIPGACPRKEPEQRFAHVVRPKVCAR